MTTMRAFTPPEHKTALPPVLTCWECDGFGWVQAENEDGLMQEMNCRRCDGFGAYVMCIDCEDAFSDSPITHLCDGCQVTCGHCGKSWDEKNAHAWECMGVFEEFQSL